MKHPNCKLWLALLVLTVAWPAAAQRVINRVIDIPDVLASSVADGEILVRQNGSTNKWVGIPASSFVTGGATNGIQMLNGTGTNTFLQGTFVLGDSGSAQLKYLSTSALGQLYFTNYSATKNEGVDGIFINNTGATIGTNVLGRFRYQLGLAGSTDGGIWLGGMDNDGSHATELKFTTLTNESGTLRGLRHVYWNTKTAGGGGGWVIATSASNSVAGAESGANAGTASEWYLRGSLGGGLFHVGGTPYINIVESDQSTDGKTWQWTYENSDIYLQAYNDAGTSAHNAIHIARASNSTNVTGITLRADAFTFEAGTVTAPAFSGPHNGTVGATTPAAGSFTTVGSSGSATLGDASGDTHTINGTVTWTDDIRQTFNPGSSAAGLNVGALAGDPSTPSNGDLWYDSTANELTARINGANVALGAGGGGGSGDVTAASAFGTDNVLIKSDGAGKGVQATGISVDDSNNITGVASLAATTTTTTSFGILDTDQSHSLGIVVGSNLSANRNLTLTTGDAARTVTIAGDTTIPIASQTVTISGPTAARTYTFPDAAATIARTDAAQTFTGTQTITQIDLGNTDTSITRSAAGIAAVEGVDLVNVSATQTLTGKTFDAASSGNVLKFSDYREFVYPGRVDGTGATITTNTPTSELLGLATFTGTTQGTNTCYAVYKMGIVPSDIDTATELVLDSLAIRTAGTDTGSASFSLAYYQPASSAAYSASDFTAAAGHVIGTTGTLTGAAANDVFYINNITLTGWASALTGGRVWYLLIARDASGDANNDALTPVAGRLSYTRTK